MSLPLAGKSIALAEGRQLEELAGLLQAEGASVVRCPLLSILDAPDSGPVTTWLDELLADRFGLLILMTGEAVTRLLGFAERSGKRDEYLAALNRVPLLVRGPKPAKALRELGVTATSRVAAAPTTAGVMESLKGDGLAGVTVGLTLFGQDNVVLTDFLRERGATVRSVLSYVYAPDADDDRVADLIRQLASGAVGAIVFTSSPQVERVWEAARKGGLEATLIDGMTRAKVAAIGPLVADTLRAHGARVDICPEQGWVMKNLVRRIARDL